MRRLAASVQNRQRHNHVQRQVTALLNPAPSLESPTTLEGVDEVDSFLPHESMNLGWARTSSKSDGTTAAAPTTFVRSPLFPPCSPDDVGQNVLGNKYAPRHNCGAYRRFPGSDADIYKLVRRRRKDKLLEDECRRLARLNKQPRLQGHWMYVEATDTNCHYVSVDDAT